VELHPPRDPASQAVYREIATLSEEARALGPQDTTIQANRITILLILGSRQFRKLGLDPMPFWREAQDLSREARRQHPEEPLFAALLANTCMRSMTWEINTGIAPWASFEEGLVQARALRDQFPDLTSGYQGLATLWIERAEYERCHGLDPRPSVTAALEAVSAATARGLQFKNPGWQEGDAHLIRGQYLLATQGAGEEDFFQATEGYRRTLQANPSQASAHNALAEATLGRAQILLERGQDPKFVLEEAEAHLARAVARSTDPGQTDHLEGVISLLRGRQQLLLRDNPEREWMRAVRSFHRAGEKAGLAKGFAGEAETKARAYRHWGRPRDRAQALAAARKALERDPQRAEAWLWIASVEQEAVHRGDAQAKGLAQEAWNRALTLDANLRRTALNLGMPRAQ
jgi:hypothetical protein